MVKIDGLTTIEAQSMLNGITPSNILKQYNETYLLSQEQMQFYKNNGFIIIKGVLSGSALAYTRKLIQSAVLIQKKDDERSLKDKTPYQQSFLQCGFLCWNFPAVKDYVFGKLFAGIARDLMKVDGVRLWHDQALFKEAGGRKTDVHQDSSYWPIKQPELTTTMWMALNEVPEEKGCLYFYPGSHKLPREYIDIFNNPHKPDFLNSGKTVIAPLEAGDVTFHTGLTYHGALENKTKEMREGMTVIYFADGNRFDSTDARNATHKSCSELKHGDLINTIYTPLLV